MGGKMKKTTGKVSAAARLRDGRAAAGIAAILAATAALLCAPHAAASVAPPAIAPDALISPPERGALRFGEAIAASGEFVIAGSPVDGDLGAEEGAAHVIRIGAGARAASGSAWDFAHLARLRSGSTGDHFGCAVAVSGESGMPTIAVGADRAWIRSGFEGAVFVFEGLESSVPLARLAAPFPQAGAEFGCCVAIDGAAEFLAVGARRDDVAGFADAGSVHIFSRAALPSSEGGIAAATRSQWRCMQSLAAQRPAQSQWFGSAIALGEDWLAVGASGASANGLSGAGCVELFRRTAQGLFEHSMTLRSPTAASHAWFGAALALDSAALIVGEPRAAHEGVRCGAAWIFDLDDIGATPRVLRPHAHPSPTEGGLGFGMSVAIDARFAVVGAPGADGAEGIEDCGAGFVFPRDGVAPTPELALQSVALTPMLLCGSAAAIARVDQAAAPGGLRVALLGHLFVEEESVAPSPGVALYALTPRAGPPLAHQDAPRTTSPACASSP